MLYVIFKVSVFVHRHGSKFFIGNVHPRNIVINDDGLIKIVTKNSLPY